MLALTVVLLWIVVTATGRIATSGSSATGQVAEVRTVDGAAGTVVAANLFREGKVQMQRGAPAQQFDFKLKGVYAPRLAIISAAGQPDRNFLVGAEIRPGIRLQSVMSDHVLVESGAGLARVDLERPGAGSRDTPKSAPAAEAATGVSLSRAEMSKMLGDPAQQAGLAQLGSYPNAGIVVNDASPGSLAARLGLRQGDVVRMIDERPIAGKEDLLRIADESRPNAQVAIDLLRNAEPVRIVFAVRP